MNCVEKYWACRLSLFVCVTVLPLGFSSCRSVRNTAFKGVVDATRSESVRESTDTAVIDVTASGHIADTSVVVIRDEERFVLERDSVGRVASVIRLRHLSGQLSQLQQSWGQSQISGRNSAHQLQADDSIRSSSEIVRESSTQLSCGPSIESIIAVWIIGTVMLLFIANVVYRAWKRRV